MAKLLSATPLYLFAAKFYALLLMCVWSYELRLLCSHLLYACPVCACTLYLDTKRAHTCICQAHEPFCLRLACYFRPPVLASASPANLVWHVLPMVMSLIWPCPLTFDLPLQALSSDKAYIAAALRKAAGEVVEVHRPVYLQTLFLQSPVSFAN